MATFDSAAPGRVHAASELFRSRVHYGFGNVGIESDVKPITSCDVARTFSVLCRHSCRHPTGRQKG